MDIALPRLLNRPFRPAALLPALLLGAFALSAAPKSALAGPFSEFRGNWSGSGTIRPQKGEPEGIRCRASYKPSGEHELEAHLRCASDSYNFDLTGHFIAGDHNQVTGQWTENSRNIGGTALGNIRGDRLIVRVEAPGLSADLTMVMHGKRQSVTISSFGAGQIVKATVSLGRS
jgi:hypothetical protein